MKEKTDRKFCVAPMMGYTTPSARKLYRILSKKTFLFTEMIACKTLIYSKNRDLVIENENHNPVALQIGGSDISDIKKCSNIAISYNYNEINLNVGCPSKAVQKGSFGACLMKDKVLVRNCLESMQSSNIITTMKCRIGLGQKLNYDFFEEFIDEISKIEIKIIYIHARNAILNGFSPSQNRSVPKLDYSFVKRIRSKYPQINFVLNGGIDSLEMAYKLINEFDGVMLGRLIQNNPFILKKVDRLFYDTDYDISVNEEIISKYFDYINKKINKDSIYRLMSPLLQIFFGIPNSKNFKLKIHEHMQSGRVKVIRDLLLSFVEKNKLLLN